MPALAGAINTKTIPDPEYCAMHGALYLVTGQIQELVRLPVEVHAGMRAAVDVTIDLITLAHDEKFKLATFSLQCKSFCLLVRNIIQRTKIMNCRHGLCCMCTQLSKT